MMPDSLEPTEIHIDPAMMGIVFSAFAWTYALAQIPGGMFLDRAQTQKEQRFQPQREALQQRKQRPKEDGEGVGQFITGSGDDGHCFFRFCLDLCAGANSWRHVFRPIR
jgi:hypothetical protein